MAALARRSLLSVALAVLTTASVARAAVNWSAMPAPRTRSPQPSQRRRTMCNRDGTRDVARSPSGDAPPTTIVGGRIPVPPWEKFNLVWVKRQR
jgi:hypothetical protein